jgi:hypothetical protein
MIIILLSTCFNDLISVGLYFNDYVLIISGKICISNSKRILLSLFLPLLLSLLENPKRVCEAPLPVSASWGTTSIKLIFHGFSTLENF